MYWAYSIFLNRENDQLLAYAEINQKNVGPNRADEICQER